MTSAVLSRFVIVATKVIEMKEAHGLGTKTTLNHVRNHPEEAIETFYDMYETTADRFKRRDGTLISGTFWLCPCAERNKLWGLMEECRNLALQHQMENNDV